MHDMIALPEHERLAALVEAELARLACWMRSRQAGLIAADGRSVRWSRISACSPSDFGVTRHWHKRVVRRGSTRSCNAGDNPPPPHHRRR